VLLDEEAAAALDEQTGTLTSGKMVPTRTDAGRTIFGSNANGGYTTIETYGDSGGASRFFYCAKAARSERGEGNDHPTVKPLALMRYLCRLTKTPTGGTVLDPFAGSGSTLIAAGLEGRPSIGIELDPHNAAICVARTAAACA
jgi:site-specific DNA-methyltransferase (adenine-specific)